jgi:hypothetical protein
MQCKKTLLAKFEEHLKFKYNLKLDSDPNLAHLADRPFSNTDSSNDPEADAFQRAKEKVLFA